MLHSLSNLRTPTLTALCLATAGLSALVVLQSDTRHLSQQARGLLADWIPADKAKQSTLLAFQTLSKLDQAIGENDFSKLHEVAAPSFQKQNPTSRLAAIFAPFKRARLPLAPTVPDAISWTKAPQHDTTGKLEMDGVFPVRSGVISFAMSFEKAGAEWKLFSIATNYRPVVTKPAARPHPARQARLDITRAAQPSAR